MVEKLIVKNFGPIKDIDLSLKRIMVFIGPQASGKSTIAKLIAIFNNAAFLRNIDEDTAYKSVDNSDYLAFFKEYHIQNLFRSDSYINYQTESHKIEYNRGIFKLAINPSTNERTERARENLLKILTQSKINKGLKKGDNKETVDELFASLDDKILDVFKETIIDKLFDYCWFIKIPLYIPAERFFVSLASGSIFNLINNNVPIAKNILNFGSDFEKAKYELNELDIKFLNAKYRYEDNQDRILLEDGSKISLLESSSGFQAIVPLMVLVNWKRNHLRNIFLIEEPELNLYPETQKNLINYLISRCCNKESNLEDESDLLITTHSPYVLTSLNNLLFAYRVSRKHPDKLEEIAKVIPQDSWLNPSDFGAYFIKDGVVRNIFNEKTGLISENELDNASEEINNEFGELMEIYKTNVVNEG